MINQTRIRKKCLSFGTSNRSKCLQRTLNRKQETEMQLCTTNGENIPRYSSHALKSLLSLSVLHYPISASPLSLLSSLLVPWGGVRVSPLGTSTTNWPIVAPDHRWRWMWSSQWNDNWQGKPKYSEKFFPSATLSTTNPTWPDLGSNPGRRGGKSATNSLSYGTAAVVSKEWLNINLPLLNQLRIVFRLN
jgi:hypothetical protein